MLSPVHQARMQQAESSTNPNTSTDSSLGGFADPSATTLPANSNAEASPNATSATASLEEKRILGFRIPPRLQKIMALIDAGTQVFLSLAGYFLKYAGLIFLLIGTVQFIGVLLSGGLAALAAGSLTLLIQQLVKEGVVMCISGGGVLYGLGHSMIQGKPFDLVASSFAWVWTSMNGAVAPPGVPGSPPHQG